MRSSIAPGFRPLAGLASVVFVVLMAPGHGVAQSSTPRAQPPAPSTGAPPSATPEAPQAATPAAQDASVRPLQSDPRRASTAAEQAARLMREGKHADALATLEASLKEFPRDAQLRFLYGVAIGERGRTQDAIDVFQQLTEDFPELPEPYNNLAVMLAAIGELDRARVALENAVRALPGYALAQENLGDVYLRMAARAYERAAQLDPKAGASREKLTLARELLARIAPKPAPDAAPSR